MKLPRKIRRPAEYLVTGMLPESNGIPVVVQADAPCLVGTAAPPAEIGVH